MASVRTSYTYLAWVWLTSIGGSTLVDRPAPWIRRFAFLYKARKPWRLRNMAWEQYIKNEKNMKAAPHIAAEFFSIDPIVPPFAHHRKPWKLQNTYQVIRRLEEHY